MWEKPLSFGWKVFFVIFISLCALIAVGLVTIELWRQTPLGRLNPVVAIINRLYGDTWNRVATEENVESFRQNQGISNASEELFSTLEDVRDLRIPGDGHDIPLRIYTPMVEDAAPLPVIVHYHGGGFVLGSIDEADWQSIVLADYSDSIVVSVGYRLAPEHRFPAAVEDAYAALLWVYEHAESFGGDGTSLAVAGDSAGANIAVVMTLMARDLGGPGIAHQILAYPSLDNANALDSSFENIYDGYGASVAAARAFRELYISSPEDRTNPYFAPLIADATGLPSATIVVGEFDILKYEALLYAETLRDAGVSVVYHEYPGLSHAFLSFGDILFTGEGRDALRLSADGFRYALGTTAISVSD